MRLLFHIYRNDDNDYRMFSIESLFHENNKNYDESDYFYIVQQR